MKAVINLLIFSAIFTSCAHQKPSDEKGRQLASASSSAGCMQLVETLVEQNRISKTYKISDFEHLALETDQFDESMIKVIRLNREPAMQEQSRIIFGLLKKLHPEEDSAELITRYQRHFSHCP
jgi:hypothetical protein